MNTPKRIQRKRTAGWRMPEGAVYVGRPTKWSNPFKVEKHQDGVTWTVVDTHMAFFQRAEASKLATDMFTLWLLQPDGVDRGFTKRRAKLLAAIDDLTGHDLACWCSLGSRCHADVLLELANPKENP